MADINDVSSLILILSLGTSLFILSLLAILLLQIRQHEIGIYLALGESKRNIIIQFIIEMSIVAIIAITLSLPTNHFIFSQISHRIVVQEMANIQIEGRTNAIQEGNTVFSKDEQLLDWFVPEVREIEE